MHKLNVLILGPTSFILTLNELKKFLKFNPLFDYLNDNPNIVLFHTNSLKDKEYVQFINNTKSIKICAGKREDLINNYDAKLELPATLKDINSIIENVVAKKIQYKLFNKNQKLFIR